MAVHCNQQKVKNSMEFLLTLAALARLILFAVAWMLPAPPDASFFADLIASMTIATAVMITITIPIAIVVLVMNWSIP